MKKEIIKDSKKNMGRTFALIGVIFFMISFLVPTSTTLWGIFLGISIILNIVGAVIVSQRLWRTYNK